MQLLWSWLLCRSSRQLDKLVYFKCICRNFGDAVIFGIGRCRIAVLLSDLGSILLIFAVGNIPIEASTLLKGLWPGLVHH